jgi:hypothetical protein
VAGSNRVHYPINAEKPTGDLLTMKLLINSVISMPGERFMTMDITDFHINTPSKWNEYMQLKLLDMTDDIIEHYKLRSIATADGFFYCKIHKGM